MIKVYIASPYTQGDTAENVKRQLDAFAVLMDLGYAPFAPLIFHFQHITHPRPYDQWMALDMEWVKACDCILRLGGESPGADKEVALAEKLGMKVYYSLEEM